MSWHDDVIEERTVERDGVTYKIEVVVDYDPDTSYLGEYSIRWEEGAIDRADWVEALFFDGTFYRWEPQWNHREFRWFIPACTPKDVQNNRDCFSRMGYSKHEAWVKANRIPVVEYETMEALNRGDWCYVGVVVTALVNGREVARDSLWGIERGDIPRASGYDQEAYIEEVAEDLIIECRAQFPDAILALKRVVTQIEEIAA